MVDARQKKRERERFERDLKEVADNLPDDMPGVEGSDIGEVHRHDNHEDARIERTLKHPHSDARQKAVDEMHLEDD